MARFNLTTVRPKGFIHSSAFSEVKSSLAWALTSLGHSAAETENAFSVGESTNIIFGCELLSPNSSIPPNSAIYNFEQPSHPNMPSVRKLAKGKRVWDFSARNMKDWAALGIDARHVPIGYTPNLTRIPKAAKQDIDVCFLGWMTPRRTKIISDLKAAGLNVFSSDNCYGGARDNVLSRSRVVLNVHHDGREMFEIVRVSYLLANSKCVVSEDSSDISDYARDLDGAMNWWRYERLVEICKELADDLSARRRLEDKGYDAIRKMDYMATVARALDSKEVMPMPDPLRPHIGIDARYDRACLEGDMADFAPWLRAHAKGQILEIGTRDGASTSAFLLGLCNDPTGHLTSIDIEDCSGLWTHPQWTFIRGNSLHESFQSRFHDGQFDLILIDGSHARDAFIGDLYNAYHWAKPGGLILCHDIVPERGHEFYAVGLREEYFKFLAAHPELKHYELPGRHGMGVIEKAR